MTENTFQQQIMFGLVRLALTTLIVTSVSCFEYERHWKILAKESSTGMTAMDKDENFYVVSSFKGPSLEIYKRQGGIDTRTIEHTRFATSLTKFSSDGAVQWTVLATCLGKWLPFKLIVDMHGASYIGSYFNGNEFNVLDENYQEVYKWHDKRTPASYHNNVLFKISTDGQFEWAATFYSARPWTRSAYHLDGDNNILACVQFRKDGMITTSKNTDTILVTSTHHEDHSVIVGFNEDGSFNDRIIRFQSDVAHRIFDIAVDPVSRDLVVAGQVNNTDSVYVYFGPNMQPETILPVNKIPYVSSYVLRITPLNIITCLLQFYANASVNVLAMTITPKREVAITGIMDTRFNPFLTLVADNVLTSTTVLEAKTSLGHSFNHFLTKLDTNMDIIWTNIYAGCTEDLNRYSIASDKFGNIYFTAQLYNELSCQVTNVNEITPGIYSATSPLLHHVCKVWLLVARNDGRTYENDAINGGFFTQMAINEQSNMLTAAAITWSSETVITVMNKNKMDVVAVDLNEAKNGIAVFQLTHSNGGWSAWSEYDECDARCPSRDGLKWRTRKCDNPPALRGGMECEGSSRESQPCQISCVYTSFSDGRLTIRSEENRIAQSIEDRYWIVNFAADNKTYVINAQVQMPLFNTRNMFRFLDGNQKELIQMFQSSAFAFTVVKPPLTIQMRSDIDQQWSVSLAIDSTTATDGQNNTDQNVIIATSVSVALGVTFVAGILTYLAVRRKKQGQWGTTKFTQQDTLSPNGQYVFSAFNQSTQGLRMS